jgi:transcription elongation factor GreA
MTVQTIQETDVVPVTARGTEVLRELEHLRRVRRREVAERLREACDAGGPPAENGDLFDALQEQELLEYRIGQLERRPRAGALSDEPPRAPGVVGIGSRVRVKALPEGSPVTYEIVGTLDAAPDSGRLSDRSPVGRALLGRRRGESAVVEAPGGRFTLEVLDVEPRS